MELESLRNSIVMETKPIVFGICGGSNSGKSFTTMWLKTNFEKLKIKVTILKEKYFLEHNINSMFSEINWTLFA